MKKQTRNDLLLVLAILLCAGAFLLYTNLTRSDGAYAVVYVSGKEVARYPLDKPAETVLRTAASGSNTLVIREGCADVTAASCPDGLCVNQAAIRYENQTIVCLPNELVVQIEGGENTGLTVG
jgi:hypothetical protein